MKNIKKLYILLSSVAVALSLTGCYKDYVQDFDYSGAYLAYQYDLRTFVVGEGMQFKIGAVLGGVMKNEYDRDIWYEFDDNLITEDLRFFVPDAETPFNAFSEMSGRTTVGSVSQDYVKNAVLLSGIKAFTPLPMSTVKIPEGERFRIKKGNHTGTITVKADSAAFLALPGAGSHPYYAIGFRLTSADVDTVLLSRSYEIIALRYENMLFGNWYHGGKTVVTDASGNVIDTDVYPTSIPSDEKTHEVYTLSTVAPDAVKTNYRGKGAGSVRITFSDGKITLASADAVAIEDLGSGYNNAKLLQDRKIFLNYSFANADGTKSVVTDTLTFRNRIRDGVNEWQDENPEHYK